MSVGHVALARRQSPVAAGGDDGEHVGHVWSRGESGYSRRAADWKNMCARATMIAVTAGVGVGVGWDGCEGRGGVVGHTGLGTRASRSIQRKEIGS